MTHILDNLLAKAVKVPSQAPGTGPYQHRTTTDYPPGTPIPPEQGGNDMGYGGGGDSLTQTGRLPVQEAIERAAKRMPGLVTHGMPGPMYPVFNELYDSQRSQDAWSHMSDDVVTVTLTPSTTLNVSVAVNPTANKGGFANRLNQFPGAVYLLLCIRSFSYAPTVTTMTGALEFRFVTQAGDQIGLGIWQANGGGNYATNATVAPSPVSDVGLASYGNLVAIPQTLGGTIGVVAAQLTMSFVYVSPTSSFRGWTNERSMYEMHREATEVKNE